MKTLMILWGLLMATVAGATSVEEVAKSALPQVTQVIPKQLILTAAQHKRVKTQAKTAIRSKVYRYYLLKKKSRTIGYGVLITRKVRSKKATILYLFSPKGHLHLTEVLAFGEPPEYLPSKTWLKQLKGQKRTQPFTIGRDVTTISGATLSARSLTDGARIARTLLSEIRR